MVFVNLQSVTEYYQRYIGSLLCLKNRGAYGGATLASCCVCSAPKGVSCTGAGGFSVDQAPRVIYEMDYEYGIHLARLRDSVSTEYL